MVKFLLENGADPLVGFVRFRPKNVQSVDDMNLEIISVLLDAKEQKDKIKWSPLKYAIIRERADIVSLLVKHLEGKRLTVDLSNQGLEYLPPCLARLPDNAEIKLDGNPLSFVPQAVRENSVSLMQYLREMDVSGKVTWNRAKVMVLGKEGVGKTHLYHRVRGLKYDKNLSTNGVDINTFELDGMELTWFDFGGQEVFYPTHQFFLTSQCIYVVVFRLDDKQYRERVQYWLQNIKAYCVVGKPAKVVVVGTHADAVSEKKEDKIWAELEQAMRENGGVVGYLSVSNKTGKGMDTLGTALQRAVEQGKLRGMQVPKYYLEVGQWIMGVRSSQPKISWTQTVQEFPHLKELQLKWACTFLANMGLCFFSPELSLVVSDLQWLATMFRALITFVGGVVVDGIVNMSKLKQVWPDASNLEIHENMLLLEQFHIAFRKVDDGFWVIPCMLSETRKVSIADKASSDFVRKTSLAAELLRRSSLPDNPLRRASLVVEGGLRKSSLATPEHGLRRSSAAASAAMGGADSMLQVAKGGSGHLPKWSPRGSKLVMKYERVFQLDVVPPGLMGRMTVRMQGQPGIKIKEMWRTGLLLETEGHDEEGVVELVARSVFIRCAADLNKQYLVQKTSEEMGALLKCMFAKEYRAPFEHFITCPHCLMKDDEANRTLLSYDECVRLVVQAEQFFTCHGAKLPVTLLGNDLTFSYVKVFDEKELTVEETPFASGGFGDVYRAKLAGGEIVVAKELKKEQVGEGFVEFQHEVSMMSKLEHSNLVRLYGIMLNPLRMVMEMCEEGDLLHALRDGKLGPNQADAEWEGKQRDPPSALAMKIIEDIAMGMHHLHSLQPPIAHRDLRSPNVLLCSLDPKAPVCAKVSDFGLSAGVSEGLQQGLSTWQWMSPEAQQGQVRLCCGPLF